MPHNTPNPDTHCPECHEPLSEFGHCWQHQYPPMDPKQDATTLCNGQCGTCSCQSTIPEG